MTCLHTIANETVLIGKNMFVTFVPNVRIWYVYTLDVSHVLGVSTVLIMSVQYTECVHCIRCVTSINTGCVS